MAGNIKGIIVEIGGDTTNLQKALSKVNSSTASLSKELKGVNSLLKLDPKNTELTAQKQQLLKESIEQTSKKLNELRKTQEMADSTIANGGEISQKNYRNLQREIINTENKLKSLKVESSKWTTAGRSIEEFGNKVTNISNKIDKLGSTLTTRLTLPVLAMATGLVNSAKEFETAFTGVEKTVDGTATQMENLKQGIKDMAEEIPASTTEISAVAEAAGQLGIQTDNVLEFTRTMINMGNATNLSADEAATTLARFANVTKMSQSDFNKLGSVIVALGNNFATTEAEISAMGMNLASAGTQVGMSQAQIMALATALSSVGLEAQAGGTAFSKVMVNMQLAVEKGGNDLKDFATVAGMSSKQFQKAFKEDATNAIMKFVDGLSKSGEKGKSAIKILDDMGITETRLRDALLRSANASDVMGKAIEVGNKAWDENSALTNEASKRYQTLDSRLQMTKNKIVNLATNTGSKLTPTFNKLLDKVDSLIDRFNGLNEEEIKNIIKTAGLVAAIGPAVKILGTLGKTTGNTIKTLGNFSKAVANVKNGIKTAEGQVGTFTTILTKMLTPTGIAITTVTALAGAMVYLATRETEAQKRAKELAKEIRNSKQALEEYNQSVDNTTNTNLSHIENIKKLKDELTTLVDENGKVKKGYESRVDFILNQLNGALGTEYQRNENLIESYQKLRDEIDETIKKKKAEIILNAEEEKYKNAIEKQTEAVENLRQARLNLGMTYDEAKQKLQDSSNLNAAEIVSLKNKIEVYEDAEKQVKTYTDNVKTYEEDYAKFVEGKYDEIGNKITVTTQDWASQTTRTLSASIQQQQTTLNQYEEMYKNTDNKIAKQNAEQAKKNLGELASQLKERSPTIEKLGFFEIEAWRRLGTNSYENYSIALADMDKDVVKKIEEMTGIIAAGTPQMQAKAEELGRRTVEEFDKSAEAKQKGLNTIKGYLNGLTDEEKKEFLRQAGIENVDAVLEELNKGNLSEEHGKKILEGLWKGLTNGTWKGKILGVAAGLAKSVNKAFTGKDGWDEHSPSKKMKKFAEYYLQPISGVMNARKKQIVDTAKELANKVNSIFDNQMNITKVQDFGKLQGSLSNQINNTTKTIFTTPQINFNIQELDETRLQQCFNYINRKFGSNY